MPKIRKAIKTAETQTKTYIPGDWCRWCAGASDCSVTQSTIKSITKPKSTVPTDTIQLIKILDSEVAILEYLNQAKTEVFNRLHRGEEIPGYKLVRSFGHSKWTCEQAVVKILDENEIQYQAYTMTKIKSPNQMKKLLVKSYPKKLDNLITRPDKGLVLVPETDKREAYKPATQDFDDDLGL